MNKPTIQNIKDVMLSNGMKVFTSPFDMTLGGIRTKDNKSGKFNDYLFMMYHDEKGILNGIVEQGTTDAGLFYRTSPINAKGTAIIKHGIQHKGCYTYMEKNGHKGQEAFKQTGVMEYWRDADRDVYLEFGGETQTAINATNGHDMGTLGNEVGKWSAGCWGGVTTVMDKFYNHAKLQMKHGHGNKFSFAMLHEDMF